MTKTEHLLVVLAEECAEVQQAVTKALRFGLDDGYPEGNTTNREDIEGELHDLLAVARTLCEAGAFKTWKIEDREAWVRDKQKRVKQYLRYAKTRGTA
jgi:NTP pyrophosphatase (non-canonical NTP hydrolase)